MLMLDLVVGGEGLTISTPDGDTIKLKLAYREGIHVLVALDAPRTCVIDRDWIHAEKMAGKVGVK